MLAASTLLQPTITPRECRVLVEVRGAAVRVTVTADDGLGQPQGDRLQALGDQRFLNRLHHPHGDGGVALQQIVRGIGQDQFDARRFWSDVIPFEVGVPATARSFAGSSQV